jgi:hypothetical protein
MLASRCGKKERDRLFKKKKRGIERENGGCLRDATGVCVGFISIL